MLHINPSRQCSVPQPRNGRRRRAVPNAGRGTRGVEARSAPSRGPQVGPGWLARDLESKFPGPARPGNFAAGRTHTRDPATLHAVPWSTRQVVAIRSPPSRRPARGPSPTVGRLVRRWNPRSSSTRTRPAPFGDVHGPLTVDLRSGAQASLHYRQTASTALTSRLDIRAPQGRAILLAKSNGGGGRAGSSELTLAGRPEPHVPGGPRLPRVVPLHTGRDPSWCWERRSVSGPDGQRRDRRQITAGYRRAGLRTDPVVELDVGWWSSYACRGHGGARLWLVPRSAASRPPRSRHRSTWAGALTTAGPKRMALTPVGHVRASRGGVRQRNTSAKLGAGRRDDDAGGTCPMFDPAQQYPSDRS